MNYGAKTKTTIITMKYHVVCALIILCLSFLMTSCFTISFKDSKAQYEEMQAERKKAEEEQIKAEEEKLYSSLSNAKVDYKGASNINFSDFQKYLDTYPEGSIGYNETHYADVTNYFDYISGLKTTYDNVKKYFTDAISDLESAYSNGDSVKAEEVYAEMEDKISRAQEAYDQIGVNFGTSFRSEFTSKYLDKADAIIYKVRNPWIESELHNDLIRQVNDEYINLPIYASSEKLGVSLRDVIDKTDFRDYLIYISENNGYIKIEVRYDFSFSQLDYDFNSGFYKKEDSATLYDFSFTMHVDGNRIILDTVLSETESVFSSSAYDLSRYFKFALIDTDSIEKELQTASSVTNALTLQGL